MEQEYPLRDWIADIIAWCSTTTLDEERKGPQIELALGGTAGVSTANSWRKPNDLEQKSTWRTVKAHSA